jgi:hypothetical protein
MRRICPGLFLLFICSHLFGQPQKAPDSFNNHKLILDAQGKILPWFTPQQNAYDQFLRQRWNFIKTSVPKSPGPAPRSDYPQYFFYCAYIPDNGELKPDTWMNDIGERVPNWVESARLYYAYSGDSLVMNIVQQLVDYSLDHGTTPPDFAWPDFPYTTANAGETEFKGFTSAKRFALHEVQVDHAGDMGLAYYRLYQYTGNTKYKTAAVNVANTLADKVRNGSASQSPWPYRVVMTTGKVTAAYGANWFGCYALLDELQKAGIGKVSKYRLAMNKVHDFIVQHPMKTGYWTDGHTDTDVNSNTYKSNMSASNAKLYLLDHPEFDARWKEYIPMLIKWTEDYFINRSAPGEPGNLWGANIVGEQDSFMYKMDYQTARYAAECARWYVVSGDEAYKEKAFRSLNWVTYCSNEEGLAFESPLSKGINSWWSDCYGECPRMFYHALAAVPEWAPPDEDHILYSTGMLKDVSYQHKNIRYTATEKSGTEYISVTFRPEKVSLNGAAINHTLKEKKNGGYEIIIKRNTAGKITIN